MQKSYQLKEICSFITVIAAILPLVILYENIYSAVLVFSIILPVFV